MLYRRCERGALSRFISSSLIPSLVPHLPLSLARPLPAQWAFWDLLPLPLPPPSAMDLLGPASPRSERCGRGGEGVGRLCKWQLGGRKTLAGADDHYEIPPCECARYRQVYRKKLPCCESRLGANSGYLIWINPLVMRWRLSPSLGLKFWWWIIRL